MSRVTFLDAHAVAFTYLTYNCIKRLQCVHARLFKGQHLIFFVAYVVVFVSLDLLNLVLNVFILILFSILF
jgi:hypothetical protein